MRIALVVESSGGGSGRHVLDLAAGLAERSHEVSLIWSPVRAESRFVEEAQRLGSVSCYAVPMQRGVGPLDVTALVRLARLLRAAGSFDVLHGHSSKAGALIRLLPLGIPGARIYTPHAFRTMDPDLGRAGRLFYGLVERSLAFRASHIIAVSEAEAKHARALGIPRERVRVVVNGVAPIQAMPRAVARAEIGLSETDVAVGFVGRLTGQKDPLRFVRAIRRAQASAPEIRGLIIGDGPLRPAAERAGEGLRLIFLGWRDAQKLMSGLDIFCMTSQYEAMPYTLLEAIQSGLPIVATEVGGIEETVIPGQSGAVLSQDAAAEAIGDELASLARDGARRQAWGEAAWAVARRHSIDRMVDQTVDVYDEALRLARESTAS